MRRLNKSLKERYTDLHWWRPVGTGDGRAEERVDAFKAMATKNGGVGIVIK